MRLSEEIRLGAMLGPQAFGRAFIDDFGSCAMGAALIARGLARVKGRRYESSTGGKVTEIWPWLGKLPSDMKCPVCGCDLNFGGVVHLNDSHRWSRESIADFVATFEPQETVQPEVQPKVKTEMEEICELAKL
jgi:hypothetical protein